MTTDSSSQTLVETKSQDKGGDGQSVQASSPPSWLDQDVALRRLWEENKTPEAIAEELGRSIAAIMTRAARLGLPRRSAPGRKRGIKERMRRVA